MKIYLNYTAFTGITTASYELHVERKSSFDAYSVNSCHENIFKQLER